MLLELLQVAPAEAGVAIAALGFAGLVVTASLGFVWKLIQLHNDQLKTNGQLVASLETLIPLLQTHLARRTRR